MNNSVNAWNNTVNAFRIANYILTLGGFFYGKQTQKRQHQVYRFTVPAQHGDGELLFSQLYLCRNTRGQPDRSRMHGLQFVCKEDRLLSVRDTHG